MLEVIPSFDSRLKNSENGIEAPRSAKNRNSMIFSWRSLAPLALRSFVVWSMSDLLISFYGDDFTGSTDAMESLARCGVRTVLFTEPPTPQMLSQYPGIGAFGVAGLTRSKPPDQMEALLRPVFTALKASGAPIIHYKVCS